MVTEAFRAVMAGGASGDPNRATAHPTARNASGGDARRPFWQVHRDEAAAPPQNGPAARPPPPVAPRTRVHLRPAMDRRLERRMGRRPRPPPRVLPVVLGPGGKRGRRSAGGGGGGGGGAYAAEGYDDVPRDEDYDPYAHGYAHGAGTREDPTTFDVDDGSFPGDDWDAPPPTPRTPASRVRILPEEGPAAPWTTPRGSRAVTRGAPRAGTAEGRPGGGNPRAPSIRRRRRAEPRDPNAPTSASTSTRTTPTRATRRTTISSRMIRAVRRRRPQPRAIGSRASAPAARRSRRRSRGALARVANRAAPGPGADTGEDTPEGTPPRLPRGAIDGPRRRATPPASSGPRPREVTVSGTTPTTWGIPANSIAPRARRRRSRRRSGGIRSRGGGWGRRRRGETSQSARARVREREGPREPVAAEGDERIIEVEVEVRCRRGAGRENGGVDAEEIPPPRKRPSPLDEPRIPHTRVPRKKFAQATLAFG